MAIPTEAEALAMGAAVLPEELDETPTLPPLTERFGVGARVQARKVIVTPDPNQPDDVQVQEVTVTGINGTVVSSAAGSLDEAEGWVFEVISQAPLVLPQDTRTTINAVLADGTTILLTGKKRLWMNEDGDLIDPALIRSFTVAS